MIISLRGTHGSGKTHLVKQILERYEAVPSKNKDSRGKSLGYFMTLGDHSTMAVVGRYDIACGGCDAIQPYNRIWPLVQEFAKQADHVLFEGALISSSYGAIGRASKEYGDDFVFAFLDTPLEQCLENISNRKKARGKDPTNSERTVNNVKKKIYSIELSKKYIIGSHRYVVLDYRKAVSQLLGFIYAG